MVPNSYLESPQQIASWCAIWLIKALSECKPWTGSESLAQVHPSSSITAHLPTRWNASPDFSQCQPYGQGHTEAPSSCCASPQRCDVVVLHVLMLTLPSVPLGWSVKVQFSDLEDSCKASRAVCSTHEQAGLERCWVTALHTAVDIHNSGRALPSFQGA